MPKKKYLINLSCDERDELLEITHKGKLKAHQF